MHGMVVLVIATKPQGRCAVGAWPDGFGRKAIGLVRLGRECVDSDGNPRVYSKEILADHTASHCVGGETPDTAKYLCGVEELHQLPLHGAKKFDTPLVLPTSSSVRQVDLQECIKKSVAGLKAVYNL